MPNWCVNRLTIKGNKNELEKFKLFAKSSEPRKTALDFNKFVPYPQTFKEKDIVAEKAQAIYDIILNDKTTSPELRSETWKKYIADSNVKDGYNSGGYEWCIENWGTKWNASEPALTEFKQSLRYDFQTAWSPPEPVIAEASKIFKNLEFTLRFWERGAAYQGFVNYKAGNKFESEEKEYRGEKGG
jgi:hypothetical protein